MGSLTELHHPIPAGCFSVFLMFGPAWQQVAATSFPVTTSANPNPSHWKSSQHVFVELDSSRKLFQHLFMSEFPSTPSHEIQDSFLGVDSTISDSQTYQLCPLVRGGFYPGSCQALSWMICYLLTISTSLLVISWLFFIFPTSSVPDGQCLPVRPSIILSAKGCKGQLNLGCYLVAVDAVCHGILDDHFE